MEPIVIIGTGLAGYGVAREFRKRDAETPVVMLSQDSGASYYKPNLSKALSAGKSPAELVQGSAADMAAKLDVDIRANTRVTGIDTDNREVQLGTNTLGYRQLVLATGAQPVRIPMAGDAADTILSVNDLDDYQRFRERIGPDAHVVIMGAGLIGCEFANDLIATGHAVTLVDPAGTVLSRFLPSAAAEALQSALESFGVAVCLKDTVEAVDHRDDGLQVTLGSGEKLEADMVLSAVGLQPDTTLADQANLHTGRGILINRRMQTSDSSIYALGDVSEISGLVLPFVAPINHAAKCIAANLSGDEETLSYPPMPVIVKTPACPTIISPPTTDGEWVIEGTAPDLRCRFMDGDGRLTGMALTGECTKERMALTRELPPLLA